MVPFSLCCVWLELKEGNKEGRLRELDEWSGDETRRDDKRDTTKRYLHRKQITWWNNLIFFMHLRRI